MAVPGSVVGVGKLITPGGQQGPKGDAGTATNVPLADTTQDGLLRKVSGLTSDFIDGTNNSRPIANIIPAGTICDTARATAPSGWLLCDGSSYTTASQPSLFAAIGYTYGGSGANFNVPDARGRTSIGAGQGASLTNRLLAATGGEETHLLSIAELASHTHIQNAHTHIQDAHSHTYNWVGISGTNVSTTSSTLGVNQPATSSVAATNQNTTATNQNTGSGVAHNTMPPFIVFNRIIKT